MTETSWTSLFVGPLLLATCHPSGAEPPIPPGSRSGESTVADAPPPPSPTEAGAERAQSPEDGSDAAEDTGEEVAEAEPKKPPACPSDMKLVEGDYCTKVEHRCRVSWNAPQNGIRVCEQFEEYAKCVGEREPKRFCIDEYAWPNEKDERPEVMNNFHQAQVKCAAVGKRLCTETEWTFACEGPDMKPFPYGFTRDPRICNGDHQWDNPSLRKMNRRDPKELARLWKGVPSGSQPECVSDFGVYDLPANTDEVVMAESPNARHSSVHTGGPWYRGVRNQCRPKVYTHGTETYGYFLSFRCCAEPDGETHERRTAKQIRDGVSWEEIEEIAGFTVEEMQEVLEKKERGECTCEQRDILCKTMCGTLLGPSAKDGTDATRTLHPSRKRIR